MLPGPVFFHELRVGARRKRAYALRVLVGLFLLYIVVVPLYRGNSLVYSTLESEGLSPHEMARIGMGLFAAILWLQGAVILLLTPAFLAGTIAEDRQRKVLTYLLASPLSGAEIVLGKVAARLINLVVLVMVGLPVVSLCLFLGGIDPADVWLAYGVSLASLYFLAGLSILLSVYSPRPRDAIAHAYILGLTWFALPIIEQIFLSIRGPLGTFLMEARPITEWIIASSPCALLIRGPFAGRSTLHQHASLVDRAAGVLRNLASGLVDPPAEAHRARVSPPGMGVARREQSLPAAPVVRAAGLRRRTDDLEGMLRNGGWRQYLPDGGGGAGIAWGRKRTGLLVRHDGNSGASRIRRLWIRGRGHHRRPRISQHQRADLHGAPLRTDEPFAGRLGSDGHHHGTRERHVDQPDLNSSGGPGDLDRKAPGAFWRVRGFLAALFLIWLTGLICGALHPLGFLSVVVATSLYSLFAVLLGTSLSLRFKSSGRSISVTIAVLMFLNVGYLFCCIPLVNGGDTIVFLAGCSPIIVFGSVFSYNELNEFLHGSRQIEFGAQVIMLVFFSFFFYGAVAIGLWHDCLNHFEIAVDRPRLDFSRFPGRVSRRGIQFVDEIGEDKEGITFVKTDEHLDDELNP